MGISRSFFLTIDTGEDLSSDSDDSVSDHNKISPPILTDKDTVGTFFVVVMCVASPTLTMYNYRSVTEST